VLVSLSSALCPRIAYFLLDARRWPAPRALLHSYPPSSQRSSLRFQSRVLPDLPERSHSRGGATARAVHPGNKAVILQNGAFSTALEADYFCTAAAAVHIEFGSFVWGTRGALEARFRDLAVREGARWESRCGFWIDCPSGRQQGRVRSIARCAACVVDLAVYFAPRTGGTCDSGRPAATIARSSSWTARSATLRSRFADQWLGDGEDVITWRDTGVSSGRGGFIRCKPFSWRTGFRKSRRVPPRARRLSRVIAKGRWLRMAPSVIRWRSIPRCFALVAKLYTLASACAPPRGHIPEPLLRAGLQHLRAVSPRWSGARVEIHLMVPGEAH